MFFCKLQIMARDAIHNRIKELPKNYNPDYLSQKTNTGICECLPGYTFVNETRECESLPGEPTKPCSAIEHLCINESFCNFDTALCECNAGMEPKTLKSGSIICKQKLRMAGMVFKNASVIDFACKKSFRSILW